jgi:hypothetical protein
MTAEPIRLIALDLDGTLIGANLTISPRVRASIVAARERGAEITIVTGRMFAAAKPFAQALGIAGPLVCYQGAAVYEAGSGALLRETPVRQDVTREVLAWAAERGVHAQCYSDDRIYVDAVNRFSERYYAVSKIEPSLVPSLREAFATRPTIKLVLVDDPERCEEHIVALRPLLGERAYITRSHVDFVEVLSPDINKGEALAFVAARYGATLAQTLAVGDAWNDVPLIDAAGIGVAMGSGPPELLARADAVVGDVAHDGVAEAIERFVLI